MFLFLPPSVVPFSVSLFVASNLLFVSRTGEPPEDFSCPQKTVCCGILQWEPRASEVTHKRSLRRGALHRKVLGDRRFRKRETSIFISRKTVLGHRSSLARLFSLRLKIYCNKLVDFTSGAYVN